MIAQKSSTNEQKIHNKKLIAITSVLLTADAIPGGMSVPLGQCLKQWGWTHWWEIEPQQD